MLTKEQKEVSEHYYETRACKIKTRHLTRALAKAESRRLSKRIGEKVRAYKCTYCDYYHVGHNKYA